jgi:hypothetical protein
MPIRIASDGAAAAVQKIAPFVLIFFAACFIKHE